MNDYKPHRNRRRRRWLISCAITISTILLIIIIISILFATVFKAKRPIITVNSVTLRNLDTSFNPLHLNLNLNVSLDAAISVKNPNKVGFKYDPSSSELNYRGEVVGEVPIPAGKVSAGETVAMNLTLTVMADRLVSNSRGLVEDLLSGDLPLSTSTRISGKVKVLFVKVKVVSRSVCHLNVSVSSRSISNSDCTYNTHLS